MVNFVHMVHEVIFEMDTQVTNFSILCEGRADDVHTHHYVPRSTDIKTVLTTKYIGITVPSDPNVRTYLQQIMDSGSRGGVNPKNLPNVQDWFPLFDLLCVLDTKVASLTGSATDETDTQPEVDEWTKQVKNSPTNIPLDYVPLSPQAKILQNKILQGTSLGEMRIDKLPDKTISFHACVEELLETMTGTESKILGNERRVMIKQFVDYFNLNGRGYVNKILHDVTGILSGSLAIDKKLDEIFGHSASTKLVNLSLAFYKLFEKEVNLATSLFIAPVNPSLTLMTSTGTTISRIDKYLEIKDSVAASVATDINLYNLFIGNPKTPKASSIDYEPFINSHFKKQGYDNIRGEYDPAWTSSSDKPSFKDKDVTSAADLELSYTYNIENLIIANKGDYPEAKAIHSLLIDLGNQIKQKIPGNKLGGAAQIASGLSFGVPKST